MRQPVRYIMRPDPSTYFPTPTLPNSRSARDSPLSWTENKCPKIVVRGVIFQTIHVEVECKVSSKYQSVITPSAHAYISFQLIIPVLLSATLVYLLLTLLDFLPR